jgi:hypothetical protein
VGRELEEHSAPRADQEPPARARSGGTTRAGDRASGAWRGEPSRRGARARSSRSSWRPCSSGGDGLGQGTIGSCALMALYRPAGQRHSASCGPLPSRLLTLYRYKGKKGEVLQK